MVNAPVQQVFMAIVNGTRYSMLVHPSVADRATGADTLDMLLYLLLFPVAGAVMGALVPLRPKVLRNVASGGIAGAVALVALDDQQRLCAALWDGAQWTRQVLLATAVNSLRDFKAFDAAWESQSGDLLVAWGYDEFAEETRYATLDRASDTWTTGQFVSTDALGKFLALASDPTTNRIVGIFGEGFSDDDVGVSVWNGLKWHDTAEMTLFGSAQSRAMVSRDKLDHNVAGQLKDRLRKAGYRAGGAVENVGAGYHTLAEAFSGWRDSPPRHNARPTSGSPRRPRWASARLWRWR